MNKLITKIYLLVSLVFFSLTIINVYAFWMIKSASFELPTNKHILILGDSHTEYAIDDKIIKNSLNLSNSAEAYLYSYIKLVKFIEGNPQIDTVLLSFHFKSLSKELDNWVLKPKYVLSRVSPYLPFFSETEWQVTIFPNPLPFLQNSTIYNLKFIIKNLLNNEITFRDLNLGNFKKSYRKKLYYDVIKKEKSKEECLGISELQFKYLNKIVNTCKRRNIRLILISTPIFKAKNFYNMDNIYEIYKNNFNDIDFIDSSNEKIPESGFSDISHLSAIGSKIYSQKLQFILENINELPRSKLQGIEQH